MRPARRADHIDREPQSPATNKMHRRISASSRLRELHRRRLCGQSVFHKPRIDNSSDPPSVDVRYTAEQVVAVPAVPDRRQRHSPPPGDPKELVAVPGEKNEKVFRMEPKGASRGFVDLDDE